LFGFLVINKSAGVTSRDVVNSVQRRLSIRKAGHAGTLDPLATGVMVVALGRATRLIPYVQRMRKTYVGEFLLGQTSTTDDVEGEPTPIDSPHRPTLAEVRAVLPAFRGAIEQVPPAFSAIKIRGQRAYARARRGEQFDVPSREVSIYELEIESYAYPRLTLRVECSSGTYIRSLGRDLASALGTGAVMSQLRREAIGCYQLDRAITVDQLAPDSRLRVLSPLSALKDLPRIVVGDRDRLSIVQGRSIETDGDIATSGEVVALTAAGDLLALLQSRDDRRLAPYRVFQTE